MAKFLFKVLPDRENLFADLAKNYPEADPRALYTHIWLRLAGSTIEEIIEEYLAKEKMSSGRFLALMILEFQPNGIKPSELATYLGVTQATVTGLIDGLEKASLVRRRQHPDDKRACVISLTDKGQKFITRTRPEFNCFLHSVYSGLSHDEMNQLAGLLEKFLNLAQEKRTNPRKTLD